MKKKRPVLASAALAVLLVGAQTRDEEQKPIPDAEIGLSKGSVFDVSHPEPVVFDTSDPGDKPLLPRAYTNSPALVPHGLVDFLPITRQDNMCIDCHFLEEKGEGDPTPIPPSHLTDLRNSPSRAGDTVVGARYVCTSCHVSQTESPPLVENSFEP